MTVTPPTAVSHYRLLELLGRGGMGEVWLAEDTELPRKVAVKLLPAHLADDREAIERLLHEARAVARVEHPNVVTVYEAGVAADGRAFLVMQRVDGDTLEQRFAQGRFEPPAAVELALAIADALAEVHALGIVHRDLKPANIVLAPRGPKILDFGIASMRGTKLTSTGVSVGTPVAMAPEQFRGAAADNRSDLWSLGVILYRALTGTSPFEGATYEAVMHGVLNVQPPAPGTLRPGLPPDLDFVVMKLLRKDPERRYARADDLVADLRNVAAELADTGTRKAAEQAPAPDVVKLAVLPFELMSTEPDDVFLADGLLEDLIVDLARLEGLHVSSRVDVLAYRNRAVPPRTIARELGVDHVVLGSVRRAGARARISAQLLRAADGHVQWAERYDRTLDDLFEVQAEISKRIADALQIALRPADREALDRPPTTNTEAYELYLRARALLDIGTLAENRRAQALLKQALDLDPKFARALGALAECHATRIFRWWLNDADGPLALQYADAALALDADLIEPYIARIYVTLFSGDREMLKASIDHVLMRNPDDAAALEWAMFAALAAGAHELEALLPRLHHYVERYPDRYKFASSLADAYDLLGRHDEAVPFTQMMLDRSTEWVRRHPEDGHARSQLGIALIRVGRTEEGLQQLERGAATSPEDARVWYNRVCGLSLAGRIEDAMTLYEKGAGGVLPRHRNHWAERDPDLENLRRHPRFAEVHARQIRAADDPF